MQTGTRPKTPRWVKAFGIAGIVVVVFLVVNLLFGGKHGPGRHLGGSGASPSTLQNVGEPADEAGADRTFEVAARDLSFEPTAITVSAGETVTFAVTNAGATVHEFTLGDDAMQNEHARAMAHFPAGVTHTFPNSITMQPGETASLTWRFGDAGMLEYTCQVSDHHTAGMRGEITVI